MNIKIRRSIAVLTAVYFVFAMLVVFLIGEYSFNWAHNDDFLLVEWYRHIFLIGDYGLKEVLSIRNGNHPLAFQAVASGFIFKIFGVNFTAIIFFDAVLLICAALTLSWLLSGYLSSNLALAICWLEVLLIAFHPVQTDHLVWAFEFGWFFINFALIANSCLLEKFGPKALPWIAILCLLGSFSSAQGSVLWLCMAIHLFLRNDRVRVWGGLACLSVFLINIVVVMLMTPSGEGRLTFSDGPAFLVYMLQLMGTLYCIRRPTILLLLGILTIFVLISPFVRKGQSAEFNGGERVSICLIVAGAVGFLFFGKGRFQYGLPWAINDMHFGPLWVPLLLGTVGISLLRYEGALQRGNKHPLLALFPCLYILLSVFASLPYANERGIESQTKAGLGMYFACAEQQSPYLVENLNITKGYLSFINEQLPVMRGLCTAPKQKALIAMIELPCLYSLMIAREPKDEAPLRDLWDVYRTHFDLYRAFPPLERGSARRLLEFAKNNARIGGGYAREMLDSHESFFSAVEIPH